MIKYLCRHDKDYSRYNIIKQLVQSTKIENNIYILLPFSKNQFLNNFFKRDKIINDFFISNYDTYVHDRQKISKYNPRAWWKYFQDWINFKFSKYLLSDTQEHFNYWKQLFGNFKGQHLVLPVLADKTIYYPYERNRDINKKIEILFYGSFIPLHGIDKILKAFKILENNKIEFNAKIIGNGQIYNDMYKLYKELNLKNVIMDGKLITEVELSNEIRKSDIVLGIFGESNKAHCVVPNKVYQALACKKALITMKSNAINEFFTQEDLITCTNNSQNLANEISLLINERSRIDLLAKNGYTKFIKLYDKSKDDLIRFINAVDSSIDKK